MVGACEERRFGTERRTDDQDPAALAFERVDAIEHQLQGDLVRAGLLARAAEPADRLGQGSVSCEQLRAPGVDPATGPGEDQDADPARLVREPADPLDLRQLDAAHGSTVVDAPAAARGRWMAGPLD